ncbi:hypothetical protein ACFL3M_00435 [Patescibacteria group bacterium]
MHCVVCGVNEEVREKRFKTRPRHYSHYDDKRVDLGEIVFGEKFEYDYMPGNSIKVNTENNLNDLVRDVLDGIGIDV